MGASVHIGIRGFHEEEKKVMEESKVPLDPDDLAIMFLPSMLEALEIVAHPQGGVMVQGRMSFLLPPDIIEGLSESRLRLAHGPEALKPLIDSLVESPVTRLAIRRASLAPMGKKIGGFPTDESEKVPEFPEPPNLLRLNEAGDV